MRPDRSLARRQADGSEEDLFRSDGQKFGFVLHDGLESKLSKC